MPKTVRINAIRDYTKRAVKRIVKGVVNTIHKITQCKAFGRPGAMQCFNKVRRRNSTVRIDPLVLTVRGYKDGAQHHIPLHKMSKRYDHSCVATVQDDGTVRLTLTTSLQDKTMFDDMINEFAIAGYKEVEYRHKGKSNKIDLTKCDKCEFSVFCGIMSKFGF